MVKGLYTSSQGMKAILRKQEVVANNLANVNTTGFKKEALFTRTYLDHVNNDLNQPFLNDEVTIDEVVTDYRPGPMVNTDNPLDLAIEGKAFFTVMQADNTLRYTRSGAFTRDKAGHLSTLSGEKVIGETGKPIELLGDRINILQNGEIEVDGRIVNKLRLAQFREPYYLVKKGKNLYDRSPKTVDAAVTGYKIHQGHLEGSNVNPIESMVRMIAGFRNYEADSKAMQATDQTLNRAVNDVGRIR